MSYGEIIASDDPHAVEKLNSRIAATEALVARWKAINAAYRKAKGAEGWGDALGESRVTQSILASKVGRYSWVKTPIEGFEFSNARQRIKHARERIATIQMNFLPRKAGGA